jgi:hypothetical protein
MEGQVVVDGEATNVAYLGHFFFGLFDEREEGKYVPISGIQASLPPPRQEEPSFSVEISTRGKTKRY